MLGRSRSQHSSSAWVKAWRISIWAVFGSVRIIGCHVTLSICLCRWSRSLKYFFLLAGKCSWLRGQSQRMRPVVTLGPGSQCQYVSAPGARTSSPHACQLSLSLESFSAECSWCGQQGNVSFPRRWVGDVIVRDCRHCVICGYWGIRLALTPRTPETGIFTIYAPCKYQTEPNIGFRILFSSGSLVESLTLSRKLKLEMLFPDTSTHLLLQQLEENNSKEKYPFLLKLFIDISFSLVCRILCKFSVTHLQF